MGKKIKVINDSYTNHKIYKDKKITLPNGDETKVDVFTKEYYFPMKNPKTNRATKVDVEEEDLQKMLNENWMIAKVYTNEQHKQRLAYVKEREELTTKFQEAEGTAQIEIYKKILKYEADDIKYLIDNDLPYVV